jgi:hypothetical protein
MMKSQHPKQPHADREQRAEQKAQREGAHRVLDDAADTGTAGSEGGGLDPGESRDSNKGTADT